MGDFLIAHRHFHRHGGDAVRTAHDVVFRRSVAELGQSGTHMNLDTFGHSFADLHVVLAAHIVLDVGCEIVAGHLDGVIGHDATERDDGRSATYVNHHVAFWGVHVDADTDGGSHWLIKQEDVAAASMLSGVAHSTQFHFGGAGGHTDDHAERRREDALATMNHLDESTHHLFAGVEVGNDAIAQRTNHACLVARLLIHQFGLLAHGNHLFRLSVERHD